MTDVFISYSRKDKPFVHRLHEELTAQGRDAWIDWEDIPPTSDWWQEICAGIDGADTFVFVVTPDSARSKVCFDEIQYAAANNKRLVPLLRGELIEEADRSRLHPAVNTYNWIFFRDTDDFALSFASLVSALETDLAYVRTQTRLLLRAREWENKRQDNSLLLRGADLAEAETWLTQGITRTPTPTKLHSDYISASRLAQSRQQRRLLMSVSAALFLTIGLAILSFALFRQSDERRIESEFLGTRAAGEAATAVYQRDISQALALAAQSKTERLGQVTDRAILLALAALEDYPYTWQAEQALAEAVLASQTLRVLPNDASVGRRARLSPDGRRILTFHEDETVQLTDITDIDGDEVVTLPAPIESAIWSLNGSMVVAFDRSNPPIFYNSRDGSPLFTIEQVEGVVEAYAWSPDGTRLLTSSDDLTVAVWDAATGEPLLEIAEFADRVISVAWSPDGRQIITGGNDGKAQVWDSRRGRPLLPILEHNSPVFDVRWSQDGTRIHTVMGSGAASSWDAGTGEFLFFVSPSPEGVSSAAWSPDETMLVTTGFDSITGWVRLWDGMTGDPIRVLARSGDAIYRAIWSPDGTRIVFFGDDFTARVWNMERLEEELVFTGHSGSVADAEWAPDGVHILTSGYDGTTRLWNALAGESEAMYTTDPGWGFGTTWSPDGSLLAVTTETESDAVMRVWNSETQQENFRTTDEWVWGSAAWTADSTRLFARVGDGGVQVWDAMTGEKVLYFPAESGKLMVDMALSPDGERLLTATEGGSIEIWAVESGNRLVTAAALAEITLSTDVGWMRDGTPFVEATLDGEALAWNVMTGEILPRVPGKYAGDALESPDGKWLLMLEPDGMEIWDIASGELVRTFPDAGGIRVAWSPDSTRIVTEATGNIAEVWDALSGERLLTLTGHADLLSDASWSPNGQRILTGSWDGTARIWDANTGTLLLTLNGEQGTVSADWSPDGRRIVSRGSDGTARIWQVEQSLPDLIDYAYTCCVWRTLTDEERSLFLLPSVTPAS